MSQHYYTVAALPYLTYDSEFKGEEDFLDFCRETISEKECQILAAVRLQSEWETAEEPNEVIKEFRAWERAFRMEIAKLRLERKKMESDPRFAESHEFVTLTAAAHNTLSQPNPLAAEEFISRSYWDKLSEMEVTHYFDFEKLILYYLKMQVLRRRYGFNLESGNEQYTKVYKNILNASVST
ncbi:MAG: hypothetical protein E4H36_11495 [Spirochaetales bacterium]|nr:MAG: hypothetical protein E4H36_11495 [Spirochaetales bacterium]